MPSIEGIRLKVRKKYIEKTSSLRNKLLLHSDFTIISNNCWGGFIYQSYRIPYNTPTVGLYFMADDYMKFIFNLEEYIKTDLKFISPVKSRYYNTLKNSKSFGEYPIGKLGDIEIIFLHYTSENEAYEKWSRRCERINWDKLIIKFNDQNGCTTEHLNLFEKLNFDNKLCFTAKKHNKLSSVIQIKSAQKQESVYTSQEPFGKSKYINMTKKLNSIQ